MRFKDLIGIIWRNMWKRKARTIFTMSGVVIGCLAVFIIVSITNGFEKYLSESMSGLMDTSVITVQPFWGEKNTDKSIKTVLNEKSVKELEALDFVEEAIPQRNTGAQFSLGSNVAYANILSKDDYSDIEENLIAGRLPRKGSKEIILDEQTAKQLLGYSWEDSVEDLSEFEGLVGKQIKIGDDSSYVNENGEEVTPKIIAGKIVGVVKGASNYMYQSLVSSTLYDKIVQGQVYYSQEEINKMLKEYNTILVRVYDKSNLEEYETTLKEMGYQTYSYKDMEKRIKQMLMGVSLILGSLAGVSLLVAALGITNTMDMAIYERNKEIGVIKVIGGDLNDVRKIFVGEACAISCIGGAISIILGFLIDGGINLIAKSITQSMLGQPINTIAIPRMSLILGILIFCLVIGFISGIIPANKAAKTDVITAIR